MTNFAHHIEKLYRGRHIHLENQKFCCSALYHTNPELDRSAQYMDDTLALDYTAANPVQQYCGTQEAWK